MKKPKQKTTHQTPEQKLFHFIIQHSYFSGVYAGRGSDWPKGAATWDLILQGTKKCRPPVVMAEVRAVSTL